MSMRSKFTAPGLSIYYYSVQWDAAALPWASFRGAVLGPTDPKEAPADAIRGMILARWKELGLAAEPNTGDNGVHASASPFEGLAERANWLGVELGADPFGARAPAARPAPLLPAPLPPLARARRGRHLRPSLPRSRALRLARARAPSRLFPRQGARRRGRAARDDQGVEYRPARPARRRRRGGLDLRRARGHGRAAVPRQVRRARQALRRARKRARAVGGVVRTGGLAAREVPRGRRTRRRTRGRAVSPKATRIRHRSRPVLRYDKRRSGVPGKGPGRYAVLGSPASLS